ncbi:MAG: carboxypeptidase-like regulatory domain-containing protein, partial [Prolixibacteraceae bacterium]|nr:carboxypeptidase-like regulatory domain-containing protein [Prolixibacteraceae bacterium]
MKKKLLRHFNRKMFIALLMLFVVSIAYAQERTVQGLITDESKTPIPGANVVVKGTTTGTVSDTEGKFTLKVPSGNTVIVVSYIGYQPQEIR